MLSLEYGNKRDNCHRDIIHEQSIGKQISYGPYKRIARFNGYFYKEDFLDWLLDLEDLFDYENICDENKVELALYKLRKYVGGNKCSLIDSYEVKTKSVHGQG